MNLKMLLEKHIHYTWGKFVIKEVTLSDLNNNT